MQPSGFIEWKCCALEQRGLQIMKTDFMTYFRNSKLELSKVIFPTKPQVKQAFFAVFVVVTFVAVFLALVDLLMSSTLSAILG
jgi:preprotein translocase subunit SecE